MSKEAIVLAGGLGTRIKHLLDDLPKPMAPVGGRPFLTYLLLCLESEGIKRVILSVGYKSEKIIKYYGEKFNDLEIIYSIEDVPLGTGGAIKKSLSLCREDHVFIINGDTFFDISFDLMRKTFINKAPSMLIALCEMKSVERYGTVDIDDFGIVKAFKEKSFKEYALINGGVYLIKTDIMSGEDLPDCFSFEKEILEKKVDITAIMAIPFDNYFIDIGVPEDFYKAQKELPSYFEDV